MAEFRAPTFAEREGAKPLPTQLQLKELSNEIRARVWQALYNSIQSNRSAHSGLTYAGCWGNILGDAWVQIDHRYADSFDKRLIKIVEYAKEKIPLGYEEFFEFLEFIIQHRQCPSRLAPELNQIFEGCGCAYRIIDKLIVPISDPEMAKSVERAFEDLSGYAGAKSHLRAAAANLSKGAHADSIRESIHAVEAVACKIAPGSNTLGPALSAIEKSHQLHPALKRGFSALYPTLRATRGGITRYRTLG